MNSRKYENNTNLCNDLQHPNQTALSQFSKHNTTLCHYEWKNTQYVSHTRNSCGTAIHRTNTENSLRLTNYRQSLLHRDWNSVKVTLQRKRKTSLQVRNSLHQFFRKIRIFFFSSKCVKSK